MPLPIDPEVELVASPSVSTGEAQVACRDGSMTLAGIVHPNGRSTSYYFQWGRDASYGSTQVMGPIADRPARVEVEIPARQLRPRTTYRYRLVATNSLGTAVGAEQTFTTPAASRPHVITGPARWADTTSVTLTGAVDPGNEPIAWWFEYGLTTAYGSTTRGGVLEGGETLVSASEPIEGLTPGTILHYRIVARHGRTVLRGEDAVFMTPLAPSLARRLRAATERLVTDHGRSSDPVVSSRR